MPPPSHGDPAMLLVKGLEEVQQRSVHRAVRRLGPLDEPWRKMARIKKKNTKHMGSGVSTRKNAKKKGIYHIYTTKNGRCTTNDMGIWWNLDDMPWRFGDPFKSQGIKGDKRSKTPGTTMIEGSKELAQWFLQKTQSFFIENPDLSQKGSGTKKTCPLSPRNKKQKPQPPLFQHITGVLSHPTCGCSSSCKWTEKPIGTIVLGVPYPNDYGGYFTIGYNV